MHLPILFHLATMVFHLVMCYFTFPVQFQLNSDFPLFFNGQFMCRAIIIIIIIIIVEIFIVKSLTY